MKDISAVFGSQCRPFLKAEADYVSPFICNERNRRNIESFKNYIAIFICFSTPAIHLELVLDIPTSTFLAALKRFGGRRSKTTELVTCASIFKDESKK